MDAHIAQIAGRTTWQRLRRGAGRIAAGLLALGIATASAAAQDTPDPLDVLVERIAADHARLATHAERLASNMEGYCAGEVSHDQLLDAYNVAVDSYQAVQWAQIGPAVLFDRRYRVNFWPDDNNAISRQLGAAVASEDQSLLDPDILAQASVAVQGLPALERLLAGQPRAEPGAYTCDLAVAIAGNVVAIAGDLAADWQHPEHMPGMTTREAALDTILGAILNYLEVISDRKIARVIGTSPEEARPRRAEAWRTGRSLQNIALNLTAIDELLYFGEDGTPMAADAPLPALLTAAGTPELIEQSFDPLYEALSLLPPIYQQTMEEVATTADGHARLLALRAAISEVRRQLGNRVFPALGLTVGFNSMDGD
ncbi:MAG: imelysin family protein [Rhodospirillaceae bacterium]|nr:imelysin family protein [Rhodospirillaceae bacterium]